jgi:non-heme chloroperoxidase
MNTITTKDGTTIYFKDWGTGPVITFSHGWPLDADAWDAQMLFLGKQGYRVIAMLAELGIAVHLCGNATLL